MLRNIITTSPQCNNVRFQRSRVFKLCQTSRQGRSKDIETLPTGGDHHWSPLRFLKPVSFPDNGSGLFIHHAYRNCGHDRLMTGNCRLHSDFQISRQIAMIRIWPSCQAILVHNPVYKRPTSSMIQIHTGLSQKRTN